MVVRRGEGGKLFGDLQIGLQISDPADEQNKFFQVTLQQILNIKYSQDKKYMAGLQNRAAKCISQVRKEKPWGSVYV